LKSGTIPAILPLRKAAWICLPTKFPVPLSDRASVSLTTTVSRSMSSGH
jgi:hypothetical protein